VKRNGFIISLQSPYIQWGTILTKADTSTYRKRYAADLDQWWSKKRLWKQ
jgi:hypothetical protein